MFEKPIFKVSFPELEAQTLKWWKIENILEKSIKQRPENMSKTFFDGPITANGAPHHGHMLTFALKDIYPRYWTMQGYRVNRSIDWDCQGIPVEYEVEKKLGFTEKKDIEKFGIEKFNQLCRESVLEHRDRIIELEERMGRLANDTEEYATMDSDYIESVWWSLSELYKKDLLYEGFKVVPYSTRAGTTLSNAEVALGGYKPIVDTAVTVIFPVIDRDFSILAWTTTPWTLPTNFALAVGKDLKYSKVKTLKGNFVVASDLVESVFGDQEHSILEEILGEELIGLEYKPLFDYFKGRKNCFKVYDGFHVTTESGTGIVHLAPYGAEDNEIFQKVGIESLDVLDDTGTFTDEIKDYAGMFYKKANKYITKDLTERERLLKAEDYTHDMPMCWRTNTPLIYKPITSWYVAMSKLRNELVNNNKSVGWMPEHIKEGRFGHWLAEIKDWGISRSRYWGTPLPVWKSESGKVKVIGSFEEIENLTGTKISDPHRPFVDDIKFTIDGEEYTRIKDVIDVWYDSGAMPFARFHYPFENKELFTQKFPAEYIAEGVDQTRGWFYSLMAISTALFGKSPYKQVVVNGMVLADDGQKLSKSKQNYTDPNELLDKFGADSIRLNFFSTPIVAGEDTTISDKTLKVMNQEYMLPIWNMYSFIVTYSNLHNLELSKIRVNPTQAKNIWLLSKFNLMVREVTESLDKYKISQALREIKDFMEEFSKWYIRISRADFANGNRESLQIIYQVYIDLLKVLSPFSPFITEYLYQKLVIPIDKEAPESIHLTDYPVSYEKEINQEILLDMEKVKVVVETGFKLRDQSAIKVRQPLLELSVSNLVLKDWMKEIIATEINVKNVSEGDLIDTISLTDNTITIFLDTKLTEELKQEGLVREIIRNLQMVRKKEKLSMEQRIVLSIDANKALENTIKKNQYIIKIPVGVDEFIYTKFDTEENIHSIKVENSEIKVAIRVL